MNKRYSVQQRLAEFGEQGQHALAEAHLLVIGAGGLGCALLPWLAGAGIGHIHLIDPDRIEESNLHRQPLYRMADIGRLKVEVAQKRLLELNPDITIKVHSVAAQPDILTEWTEEATLIIDAADRFSVTYMASDLCLKQNKPFISASVSGWGGYAGVFCGGGPGYRAVFPEFDQAGANCGQTGVLGPVVGMLGALQAQLCLSLLLGISPSPVSTLFHWDAKSGHFNHFSFRNAVDPAEFYPFLALSQLEKSDRVIDLRPSDEQPKFSWPGKQAVQLDALQYHAASLPKQGRIILCCKTGLRAARAARLLTQGGFSNLALLALEGQVL